MVDLSIGIVLLPLIASYWLRVLNLLALQALISEVSLSSIVETWSFDPTVWSSIAVLHLLGSWS